MLISHGLLYMVMSKGLHVTDVFFTHVTRLCVACIGLVSVGYCSNVGQCGGPLCVWAAPAGGASQPRPAIEHSGCDARVYIVCLHVCHLSCLPLAGDYPVRSRGCTMQLRVAACANSHLAILQV